MNLTKREQQVLDGIKAGKPLWDIRCELDNMSKKTMDSIIFRLKARGFIVRGLPGKSRFKYYVTEEWVWSKYPTPTKQS